MFALCQLEVLVVFVPFVSCSLYDPHVFPARGPFVEHWYIRLSDHSTGESYAVLFGTVLARHPYGSVNPAYFGILRSQGDGKLVSKDVFPALASVMVTRDGAPIARNPDANTAPNFEWRAEPYGFVRVNATGAVIDVTIDDVHLHAIIGLDDPWNGNTHLGPENWLVKLPLPLHWFVYSLASPALYRFTNATSNQTTDGRATAHMEKNWGGGFPHAWFWAQGRDERRDVTLVLSGGWLRVGFGLVPVRGHLVGYRNHARRISLDFRPDNSLMRLRAGGCRGSLRASFTSPTHKLTVTVSASPATFSKCLYGPTSTGFRHDSVQSFAATAEVTLYRRKYLVVGDLIMIDRQTIRNAALEFGGEYMCEVCDGM